MAKKQKFTVEIEMCENTMLAETILTKTEFNRQLKLMRNQVIVTKDYETPVTEPEWSNKVFDHPTFTETVYVFNCGCCSTYLTMYETKNGYVFK